MKQNAIEVTASLPQGSSLLVPRQFKYFKINSRKRPVSPQPARAAAAAALSLTQ